ncbi:MAG: cell division protein FtsW [candidate division Zixibacteria bacterium]|nr:cell division protein FtsW [candidate division Zixibacteria bacterium]
MKLPLAIADGLLEIISPHSARARGREPQPASDRLVWFAAMGLMALGTVMVLSSSVMLADRRFGTPGFFWIRQMIWWFLATVLLVVFSRIDHRHFRTWAPLILILGLGGLGVALTLPPIKDVHRWINLGPLRLQPAELFRLAFVVYAAAFLARRGEQIIWARRWLLLVGVLALGSGLLLAMPEFSAVLTLWATTGFLLLAAGVRWRHVLPSIVTAVVASTIVVYGFGYKKARVDDWQAGLTMTGGSYQVKQSKLAFGSGGLFGKGLGEGRAKMSYLPEPHTDFILSSIGEELGLVGITAVWLAFGLLVYRAWRAAMRAPDRFGYLLCIGIGASLLVNAALNASVATGLSPVTGLPLPFVSYGGSSLLCTAAGWGMVLNVSRFRLAGR